MKIIALVLLLSAPVRAEDAAAPAAKEKTCAPAAEEGAYVGCVEPMRVLADGYKSAHQEFSDWLRKESERVQAVFDKEKELQEKIKANRSESVDLKFKDSKENKRRIKDLEKEDKQLWKDLKTVEKEKAAACKTLKRGLSEQSKRLEKDLRERAKRAEASLQ